MSLNLHITVDGEELVLYQTPTYITHKCLALNDKTQIISCYIEYVKDDLYQCDDTDERTANKRILKKHTDYLTAKLAYGVHIEVYGQ